MDRLIVAEIRGHRLELETRPGLFSPEHADRGTLAMLSCAHLEPGMRVMDLGCGCGVVGILAARICGQENVVMSDVDPAAVEMARRNAARRTSSCPISTPRRWRPPCATRRATACRACAPWCRTGFRP